MPASLIDAVKNLDCAQLQALAKLVRERLHQLVPVEFAGVVTQVCGDTFTVAEGGKGHQVEKTFTVTPEKKILADFLPTAEGAVEKLHLKADPF